MKNSLGGSCCLDYRGEKKVSSSAAGKEVEALFRRRLFDPASNLNPAQTVHITRDTAIE